MALNNIVEYESNNLKHTKINYNNNHVSLNLYMYNEYYIMCTYIYNIYRYINIF